MRNWMIKIGLLSVLPLAGVAGCTVHTDGAVAEPAGYAVVEPGYYYDDAYVDVYGTYHPRVYYYYNGHGWEHRDRVPHGYVARAHHFEHRDVRQERHEEHSEMHRDIH